MRTGAVGVVFLAAVLCFGVQSRREKQTVVLETQAEDADAAETPEKSKSGETLRDSSGGQSVFSQEAGNSAAKSDTSFRDSNGLQKEQDDSPESFERSAKRLNGESADGDSEAAEKAAAKLQSKGNSQPQEEGILYIHVCGEVAAPGVYELPAGSRMYEAVEKAGGMTSEAAQEYVNLAQAIEDGQQLWIPSKEEIRKYRETGKEGSGLLGAGGAAGTGSVAGSQRTGSSAGTSRMAAGAAGEGGSSASGTLVNLNTASKEELMTLSGIGAARAEAILSYREQKGGFRTIEDIMKVPGIKNAAFQKIKDKITV